MFCIISHAHMDKEGYNSPKEAEQLAAAGTTFKDPVWLRLENQPQTAPK